MREIRLAMVQFESTLQEVAQNVRRAIDFIKQAAAQHADLVVFPELCTSGYDGGNRC